MPSTSATILASRTFYGSNPSTQLGNVSWNEDGQCAILTKRGVTIITPHLVTSLPPPPVLLNENTEADASGNAKTANGNDSDDDGAADANDPSSMRAKLNAKRPEGGDVKWWTTGVEVRQGLEKEREATKYGWHVEDEMNTILKTDELYPRMAVWSPSGLSVLGGCMLAMLSSSLQVSVYSPLGDPMTGQWHEVADITALSRATLHPPPVEDEPLSIFQVKQLQTTCLAWSPAVTLSSTLGKDLSVLAIANRAGEVNLWSYGPRKQFIRVGQVKVAVTGWVTNLSWSAWTAIDNSSVQAQLAVSTTSGVVSVIPIRQPSTNGAEQDTQISTQSIHTVDGGDKRHVGSLTWMENLLVWTKPGSVHLWSARQEGNMQWDGVKSLRLGRIGNWAGANALAPCVGIQKLHDSTILLTLATLSTHLITDIYTTPTIAPVEDTLLPSLAARNAFLDYAFGEYWKRNKYRVGKLDERSLTAHTGGWVGMGQGGIALFLAEVSNFHNLEVTMEGMKLLNLFIADISASLPHGPTTKIDNLQALLSAPPSLLHSSPLHLLAPHVLKLISDPPNAETLQQLLTICEDVKDDIPLEEPESTRRATQEGLIRGLFGDARLDGLRLRYLLSSWCARTLPGSPTTFQAAARKCLDAIRASTTSIILQHVMARSGEGPLGAADAKLLRLLQQKAESSGNEGSIAPSHPQVNPAIAAEETEDRCPACGGSVGLGDDGQTRCANGHEWARCTITHQLITHPVYRICTSCTAIALLPRSRSQELGGTSAQRNGVQSDRPAAGPGDGTIQAMLEACSICPTCGGRWMRTM